MAEALLIVDMLNDFVLPGAPLEVPATREILPALKVRLQRAREQGAEVIFICDAHAPDDREFERMGWPPHAIAGTPGATVVDALTPLTDESLIRKTTYSGFHQTDLLGLLRRLGLNDLIITGCVTNICILYTAAEAVMHGFRVSVPRDCVAGLDPASSEFALTQMEQVLGVEIL